MENPGQSQGGEARSERLDQLRRTIDHALDEIVSSRADRAKEARKEFDAAWRELNAEVSKTVH